MAEQNAPLLAFNRGRIGSEALARIDLQRMAFSADEQTNLPARVLGSMRLRPGMQYIHATLNNLPARYINFIFSTTDFCMPEVTADGIRFSVDDAIITRQSVSTAIANGTFDTDLTSWTDADETGAVSQWLTGGFLELVGTLFSAAIRRQQVTVAAGDLNVEHGVRFTITRGPVSIKIGSTAGGDEYITEKEFGTGAYSFVFTPTGNFHIEIAGRAQAKSIVDSIEVEAGGDFILPSPWAVTDLQSLRWTQSLDVLFIACDGYQQRRLERYDLTSKSWGISLYQPIDGPFRGINIGTITLTPSGLTGDITLTASRSFFRSTHVGALFKITSVGQQVESALTGQDQFSNSIRVVGITTSRIFTIAISGRTDSTITLQRSIDEEGAWVDVSSFTADQAATNHDDGLDNQIAYYRIGIKTGDYGTDTVTVTMVYASGGLDGVARVTAFTSSTVVDAAVVVAMGATDASRNWYEGSWSDFRGWVSAVALYEGRLWWQGKGQQYGSISDAYDSFDSTQEGLSAPINRSVGSGAVDRCNWLLALQRLIAGTDGAELSVRSTSFDEVVTVDNWNIKDASTQGSANMPALKIDQNGVFVQRSQRRVYETSFELTKNDYTPVDLTDVVPEIGEPGIVWAAVQRQIDTRLHFPRSDGTVAMLIREPDNDVLCWLDVETDGEVVDVVVLPDAAEDRVYYQVKRTINGATVYNLEKWALESECAGGTVNRMADSFVTFTNASPSATVSGLTHLIGESVVCWADGKCMADANGDIATFTVDANGEITLSHYGDAYEATTGMAGLPYRGRFKSVKLSYASELGTALTQRKRLSHLGMILKNTHHKGVKYGPDFDTMDDLPEIDNEGAVVARDTIHATYDKDMFEWPGGWGTDERMCLEMNAPRPCTVLAVVVGIDENDKA